MAASNLLQTTQSLIRGTVRGILAQRGVTVRVIVTWAAHVDTCARVLAASAQRAWFWFHHSVRMTLYAVHRARQRILLGTLSSLRRLATRALRHMDVLELAVRSALIHTATVARANLSHQQLSYLQFRTWASMVTHKLGDRDNWLTAAMWDALQLARTSQYGSMRNWRQEALDEVRTCISRWLIEQEAWLEEISGWWYLVRDKKKRPASVVDLSLGRVSRGVGRTTPTPGTTSSLLESQIRQNRGRFSCLDLPEPTACDIRFENQHTQNTTPDTMNWADTARGRAHLHTTVCRLVG